MNFSFEEALLEIKRGSFEIIDEEKIKKLKLQVRGNVE